MAATIYSALLCKFTATLFSVYYLEGRQFFILTDHKTLPYTLTSSGKSYTPRELRHMSFILEFTHDIRFIHDHQNSVADAFSRPELQVGVQRTDSELRHHPQTSSTPKFLDIKLPDSDATSSCDVSAGRPRPFVPVTFRRQVFDWLHSISHPGARATQNLFPSSFVSPRINTDVRKWTRECVHCQR